MKSPLSYRLGKAFLGDGMEQAVSSEHGFREGGRSA